MINHSTDDPSRNQAIHVQCDICGGEHALWVRPSDWAKFGRPIAPHIQNLFPYLSAAERELLLSKTCGDCFDRMWAPALEEFTPVEHIPVDMIPTWIRTRIDRDPERYAGTDVTWCRFRGETTFYAYRAGKWVGQFDLFDV